MASSFTALKIKEIHSGVIHKVGGRVKTWHKRWLILKSDYTLQYFKDPSKAPLGSISITDPSFSIERGQDGSYTGWPRTCSLENTMIITTSGRVYYMYTDSLSETEEWIRVIEQQRQSIEKSTPQSLPGRYNKMGGKASSLEMPSVVEPTNRTPKQYRKKDRRLPTKRFNSAMVTDSDEGSPIDSDTGADGQLDPNEFNSSCVETSITSPTSPPPEPLYDLVTQANIQEDTNRAANTSTNTLLPPRDIGNRSISLNSVGENRNLKDSVCLNESLYDLVGRINAGEEDEGGAPESTTKNEEGTEPQELYEPIADVPLDKGPPTPSKAKPSIPPPPPPTSQQYTEQLYDSVDEVNIDSNKDIGVMYEDVDRESGLKEAESSDDDDDERVPLPSSSLPQIVSPPPPLPPRAGEEMYDNAPTLPPKQTDTSNKNNDDEPPDSEDYYGNSSISNSAPLRIPVPSPLSSPSKPPKPLPRTIDPNTHHSAITTNGVTAPPTGDTGAEEYGEELYDDIQGALQSSSGSDVLREEKGKREDEREIQREEIEREEIKGDVEGETKREENEESRHKEEEEEEREIIEVKGPENNKEKENGMNNDKDSEPANPTVKVSSTTSTPPSASKGKRVHAATVGSTDTGIEMFYRRAQELSALGEEEGATKATKQAKDLFQTKKEAILSSEDKVVLAETLREVEAEKQLASEEKFKWERERLKFEEERKKFEREKQELLEELAKAKRET